MQKKIFLTLLLTSIHLFGIECIGGCNPEPECECPLFNTDCAIILDAEFLYWTAQVNPTEYAIKMTSSEIETNNCGQGKYQTADYSMDPGFRVAARYHHAHKYWEILGQYTRLVNCGKDTAKESSDFALNLNATFEPHLDLTIEQASSNIELTYQVADILVSRIFDPNPHLRLRLFSGITGAWIDQTWRVNYLTMIEDQSALNTKWQFNGGGLRAGLSFDWYWFWNIYLTGKTSFALLAGSYENKIFQESTDDISPFNNTKLDQGRMTYHVQFLVGPSYQLLCSCWDFELFVGYEMNAWTNLHQVYQCIPNESENTKSVFINQGLLGLQGLTVRATIGF